MRLGGSSGSTRVVLRLVSWLLFLGASWTCSGNSWQTTEPTNGSADADASPGPSATDDTDASPALPHVERSGWYCFRYYKDAARPEFVSMCHYRTTAACDEERQEMTAAAPEGSLFTPCSYQRRVACLTFRDTVSETEYLRCGENMDKCFLHRLFVQGRNKDRYEIIRDCAIRG